MSNFYELEQAVESLIASNLLLRLQLEAAEEENATLKAEQSRRQSVLSQVIEAFEEAI